MKFNIKKIVCKITSIILSLSLLGITTLFFIKMWYENFSRVIPLPFWKRGNYLLFFIYAITFNIFQRITKSNKFSFKRSSDILFGNIISIILTNIITFLQSSLIARRFLTVSPFIWLTILQLLIIFPWLFVSKILNQRFCPPRKMLIIIGRKEGNLLKNKMSFDSHIFHIAETIYLEQGINKVLKKISDYQDVVISDVPTKYRNVILKACSAQNIRVFMSPKISDIIIRSADDIFLFDTPLLLVKGDSMSFTQEIIKRALDIIISSIAIIIFSPLLLIISISLKIFDKGKIIYSQERFTKNGKIFMIYKFRSMVENSEKDGAILASKNDDRITPIGNILRKTHFDELPQLFNIFLGDMSIVGPRPERPEIHYEYEKLIPEFSQRLEVKAGLTGYAQVYGKYNTTPYDKLKHDIQYVKNYSLKLDILIMVLTLKVMFRKETSEGVDENQSNAIVIIDED